MGTGVELREVRDDTALRTLRLLFGLRMGYYEVLFKASCKFGLSKPEAPKTTSYTLALAAPVRYPSLDIRK